MAKQAAGAGAKSSTAAEDGDQQQLWLDAEKGYRLALVDGKLVCRNPQGRRLASVPKWLKETGDARDLLALRDWLAEHAAQCKEAVELWMLRSLPVPRAVVGAVWPDKSWRRELENMVVAPALQHGLDQDRAGFLRAADESRGLGIVDLDGETQWLDDQSVVLPHPILLEELDDFRELSAELKISQGADQLFRQTWRKPDSPEDEFAVKDFAEGKFEQLNFVLGHCRRLGYRVRGGNACCPVWEDGQLVEARYWVGAEYPESETWTGTLGWVDARESRVRLEEVGPVAYSEGVRMAAAVYAKRVIAEDED